VPNKLGEISGDFSQCSVLETRSLWPRDENSFQGGKERHKNNSMTNSKNPVKANESITTLSSISWPHVSDDKPEPCVNSVTLIARFAMKER